VLYARRMQIQRTRKTQMALDAQQVQALQDAAPPTDWSKFDQGVGPSEFGRGPYAKDDTLHPRFFILARIDLPASNAANRPIYRDIPYIEVLIPGDKNNIVCEPVWDHHKQRFPQHWEQFMRGEQQQIVGTRLAAAPFLNPARIAELNYMKIFTIEQLANLVDSAMGFMGAHELKAAARRFLDTTSSNEALLERIQALEAQLAHSLPIVTTSEALPEDKPKKNFGR